LTIIYTIEGEDIIIVHPSPEILNLFCLRGILAPAITVDGGANVTGLIDNSGDISGGITNQAVGTLAGTPVGTITGTLVGISVLGGNAEISGDVNNAGLIEATDATFGIAGINVASTAEISGAIINSGTIMGARNGIAVNSSSATISGGITASYDYERKDEFNGHSAYIRVAAPF